MRPLIPWRSRAAIWLVLPASVLVLAYAVRYSDQTTVVGYWPSATAGSAIYLLFSCALASAGAAWEGRRFRLGNIGAMPSVRSTPRILVGLLWPVFVAACFVQVVAFLVMSAQTWGAPGGPSVLVLVTYPAVIFFHLALGFALGRWLPPIVSIPLALLVSYSWLGFTWSVSYFPLRYLAGLVLTNCCTVETELNERAPLIALAFSVVAGLGVLMVATLRGTAKPAVKNGTRAVGVGTVVGAVVVGLLAAGGLGATPLQERPAAEARCAGSSPKICLFPEQDRLSHPAAVIRRAVVNLREAGISVPDTIRTSNSPSSPAQLNMIVQVNMSEADLVHSLTASLLPPTIASYCGSGDDYEKRLIAATSANRWLNQKAAAGIVDPDTVAPAVDEDDTREYKQLKASPMNEQQEWVRYTLSHLTNCSNGPRAVPSS